MNLHNLNNTEKQSSCSPSCGINIFSLENNIYFCGYSILKATLQGKSSYLVDENIMHLVNNYTSVNQRKTLLKMHCNQIVAVNTNNKQDQELAEKHGFYTNKSRWEYLLIANRKLENVWENIDYLLNTSSILPSWKNTILYSSICAFICNILSNWGDITIIDTLLDISSYSCASLLLRSSYQFISYTISSKPLHHLIRRKKIISEANCFNLLEKDFFLDNLNHKNDYSVTPFIDIDKFYFIFDNLYKTLNITREETPYFFKVTLLAIANTWMSMVFQKNIDTNACDINKQIIENTLLILELNIMISQNQTDITLSEESNLTLNSTIDIQDTTKENILYPIEDQLSNLKQGFYTSICEVFFVLYIDDFSVCRNYFVFIPLLNMVYSTPKKQFITEIIKNLSSNNDVIFIQIGGEL